ncbi:MAG: response regulator, partial [Pseudomonadota bacterium]
PGVDATPVIVLSSMDAFDLTSKDGAARADAALTKPVAASPLFDQIADTLLAAAARRDESGASPASAAETAAETTAKTAPEATVEEAAAEPKAATEAAAAVAPPAPAAQRAEAAAILIVEDNRVNQIVAVEMLRGFGRDAAIAENGLDGLEAYARLRPKLIFMDVSMPVMDGLTATGRIREYEREAGVEPAHIVGLTAHAMRGDREKCLDAGMDDYIAKPISAAGVRETLAKVGLLAEDDASDASAAA